MSNKENYLAPADWLRIPIVPEFLLDRMILGPIPQPNYILNAPLTFMN